MNNSLKTVLILLLSLLALSVVTVIVIRNNNKKEEKTGIQTEKSAENSSEITGDKSEEQKKEETGNREENPSGEEKDNNSEEISGQNSEKEPENDPGKTGPMEELVPETVTEEATPVIPEKHDEWMLVLVNRWNPIPEDYEIGEMEELVNGNAIDKRIYPELQQMFDDMRAAGLYPHINSSFRTAEDQQRIMDEKIADYIEEGHDEEEAKTLAESWVAIPGRSEHQIGLCLDIGCETDLDEDAWAVWDWLLENSYNYGFIRRYPEDKTEITGVINEPWHFRYVGREAAAEIYEQGLCLEEYLGRVNESY